MRDNAQCTRQHEEATMRQRGSNKKVIKKYCNEVTTRQEAKERRKKGKK
jgi:hypothetical protein